MFLKDVESKQNLASSPQGVARMVKQCRQNLSEGETSDKIKELLKYRHNVVAHKNFEMPNAMSASRITSVTIGTPRDLLDILGPVIIKLHRLFFGSAHEFTLRLENAAREAVQVLDFLSVFLKRVEP